jgi:ureidoglycolate lyase
MRQVICQPLEQAAFARFGSVIDAAGTAAQSINDGTTRRYSDLARLDLRGPSSDPVVSVYEASARAFPLRLLRLERHAQAAQVFLPLGPHRFIVVVAPAMSAPGTNAPDWLQIAAFVSLPGQGVSLERGCWHHGLIALADGDRFAVIEGGDYRNDTTEVTAPEAVVLLPPS